MLPLSPIPEGADTVFLTCIGRIEDDALRNRLAAIKNDIISHDSEFAKAGASSTFFKLASHESVGTNVTKAEMISVYDHQMVPAVSRGRVYYDKIMALAKNRRCPLCGFGQVLTLDHYLPKTHYPGLAVCPRNLLPSCSDCNKTKLSTVPSCASKQTLHPYFDNVDGETWLHAKFETRTPVVVEFSVQSPPSWSAIQAGRVRHHFKAFKLASVYSTEASTELQDIKWRLTTLLNTCGPADVTSHLEEEATSRIKAGKNSWKAALYRALAASAWFCNVGCKG